MVDRADAVVDLILNDKRFTDALRGVEKKMQKLAATMQKVATAAKRIFIAATAAATLSIVAFGRFESSMARVKALTDATGESFKQLNNLARDLGKTTVFTANQAAQAMGFLAQSGFAVKEIMELLPSVLNLAAAGQLDMANAASIASKIVRGMNIETSEFAGTVDVLAKAFTTSNTNLEELGQALKFVGPVAAAAGISLETTVAALQALADAGFAATIGGTAFRRIAVSLQSTKFAKFFEEGGLSIEDMNGKLKDLPELLRLLQKRMETVGSSTQQTAKLFELFGLRGGPGIQILLAKGADALTDMRTKLLDAGGAAQKIAQTQLDTLSGEFRILTSVATEAAISIGESLAPMVEFLSASLRGAIQAFNDSSKSVKTATALFLSAGVALSGMAFIVAKLAPAMLNLSLAVKAVTASITVLQVQMGIFLAAATIATGLLIARWATWKSLIRETAQSLEEPISALERLTKANRDLTDATTKGAAAEVTALENKKAALSDIIEEIEAEREAIQTTLKEAQDKGLADLRTFAEPEARADDARARAALVQNATRQLAILKEQRDEIDLIIGGVRRRAEQEALIADEEKEQALVLKAITEEKEKQEKIDDKGFKKLRDLRKEFAVLSGLATRGQIELFDLENLGVAKEVLAGIRFEQRQIAQLQEEMKDDEIFRGLLDKEKSDAAAFVEASLSEQERITRSLLRVEALRTRGNLTNAQAAKITAGLQKKEREESLRGQLTSGEALFRRISESLGSRGRASGPAATTAKNTAATATATKKSLTIQEKMAAGILDAVGVLEAILRSRQVATFGP